MKNRSHVLGEYLVESLNTYASITISNIKSNRGGSGGQAWPIAITRYNHKLLNHRIS